MAKGKRGKKSHKETFAGFASACWKETPKTDGKGNKLAPKVRFGKVASCVSGKFKEARREKAEE